MQVRCSLQWPEVNSRLLTWEGRRRRTGASGDAGIPADRAL